VSRVAFWKWSVFDRFDWDNGATLLAAAIAAAAVLLGFFVTSAHNRRQRRAQIYADAVGAVSAYLEGPYRVARCHNTDEQRYALTTDISAVQARIDAVGLLLRLHAPKRVAKAFEEYVKAARREAGRQMTDQWNRRPARRHRDMNVGVRFPQPCSIRAKAKLVREMDRDIKPQWFRPWTWLR